VERRDIRDQRCRRDTRRDVPESGLHSPIIDQHGT